jgi:hypothetical protein
MWLNDVSVDDIKSFIQHTSTMIIVSKVDGTILWANESFCTWIKYTNYELLRTNWITISSQDSDLEADRQELSSLTPSNNQYSVQKRYIPKNSKPELGTLTVVAFFKDKQIDYCINVWEPFKNGTAAAFDLSITTTNNMSKAINELTNSVSTLTVQKEEEKFLLSIFKMVQKYPKISATVFFILVGLAGFDNILNTLQRLGILPSPSVHIEQGKK